MNSLNRFVAATLAVCFVLVVNSVSDGALFGCANCGVTYLPQSRAVAASCSGSTASCSGSVAVSDCSGGVAFVPAVRQTTYRRGLFGRLVPTGWRTVADPAAVSALRAAKYSAVMQNAYAATPQTTVPASVAVSCPCGPNCPCGADCPCPPAEASPPENSPSVEDLTYRVEEVLPDESDVFADIQYVGLFGPHPRAYRFAQSGPGPVRLLMRVRHNSKERRVERRKARCDYAGLVGYAGGSSCPIH